jgi:CspA family cold shock protein
MDNNIIHTGRVVFYNTEKAYGFINDYITNKDLFVHRTGLIDSIKMDDEVTFEINRNEKGLFATDVRVVNKCIIIIDNKEYNGNEHINGYREIKN